MGWLPNENSRVSLLIGYVREHMLDAGDQITYDEVLDLLGMTGSNGNLPPSMACSGIVSEVNRRLSRDGDWRHLINVPNFGYRVGKPSELRLEAFGRMKSAERQMVGNQRAIEKVIRHPDATASERRRAADAAAANASLVSLVRKEQRKIKKLWPAEESSPVLEDDSI